MQDNTNVIKIGGLTFFRVCRYKDVYNKNGINDYSAMDTGLDQAKDMPGLYVFVIEHDESGRAKEVLYIGESHANPLPKRIKQHFRDKDTGGLRMKLSKCRDAKKVRRIGAKRFICMSIMCDRY